MNSRNKRIALDIIKAQVASDGGKFWKTPDDSDPVIWRVFVTSFKRGYDAKDQYIKSAISKIIAYRNSGFKYNVRRTLDQNGYPSYIIYFNFELNGERKQISFHSPSYNSWLEKYCSNTRSNMITWDHKSSRNTAIELYEAIR